MASTDSRRASVQDRGPAVFAVTTTTLVLATAFVVARLVCRKWIVKNISWDDTIIALAWFLAFALSFTIDFGVRNGLGRHNDDINPDDWGALRRCEYVFSILYVCRTIKPQAPSTPADFEWHVESGFDGDKNQHSGLLPTSIQEYAKGSPACVVAHAGSGQHCRDCPYHHERLSMSTRASFLAGRIRDRSLHSPSDGIHMRRSHQHRN
jgi:hypothetical protein